MVKNDIAPCGLACCFCELNEKNGLTKVWEMVGKAYGKTADEIKCRGCWEQDGCTIHDECETLECAKEKGIDSCSECIGFPCEKLHPALDLAERLPHNIKLYNLCRIKRIGPEEFLKEAQLIKERYFKGKMVIGAGPRLPD